MGSTAIDFDPGEIFTGHYTADPKTAGSTMLLLQVSLPCLVVSPSESVSVLALRGGTNASLAPQVDYAENVFLPFIRHFFGIIVNLKVGKRGYAPKGGGEVNVEIHSRTSPILPITLTERGQVKRILGTAFVAGALPSHLANTMAKTATQTLRKSGCVPADATIDIRAVSESPAQAVGSGSGIMIWAETDTHCRFGGSALGRKNRDARDVGNEAAEELIKGLKAGGCVDEYLQVCDVCQGMAAL